MFRNKTQSQFRQQLFLVKPIDRKLDNSTKKSQKIKISTVGHISSLRIAIWGNKYGVWVADGG